MTLEDVRIAKRLTEEQILSAIRMYERITGLTCESVCLSKSQPFGERQSVIAVEIKSEV
jgi:hypothetical protein